MGKIYTSLLLAVLVFSARAEHSWQTDFEAAKAQAKKDNKAMLLDFTGSDWCGFCIRLKKAVFTKPEFEKFAEKNLVLVELDFPHGKKLPSTLAKQNENLQEKYKIGGFPTIVILDSGGKELGRLEGYEGDNASAYVQRLEKILAKQKSTAAK